MFGPWRQYSLISVNKISDAVRKKCLKKWRNFDVGEQPITIKLCVFVMEMANKHDGNDINNNIITISLSVTSLQVAELFFGCSLDHLLKMINSGGRALVLHSQ